jgi:hypothetical protein
MFFERIFTTENQQTVFETVEPFVLSALNGKTVGLFAYGGTGSGKTYTIGTEHGTKEEEGIKEEDGILPRLIKAIMDRSEDVSLTYTVVEIVPAWNISDLDYRIIDLAHMNYLAHTKDAKGYYSYDSRGQRMSGGVGVVGVGVGVAEGTPVYAPNNAISLNTCNIKLRGSNEFKFKPTPKAKSAGAEAINVEKEEFYLKKWYEPAQLGISTCTYNVQEKEDHYAKTVKIEGSFHHVDVPAETVLKEVLNNYYSIVKLRRSEDTVGNSKSSRTHLLTTLKLRNKNGTVGEIYVMDLAEREASKALEKETVPTNRYDATYVANNNRIAKVNSITREQNRLTNGINFSLNWLIKWIKLKKQGFVIKHHTKQPQSGPKRNWRIGWRGLVSRVI